MFRNLQLWLTRILPSWCSPLLAGAVAFVLVLISGIWYGPLVAQQIYGTPGSPSATSKCPLAYGYPLSRIMPVAVRMMTWLRSS